MDEVTTTAVEEQTPPGSTAKLIRRVRKATERRFTAGEKILRK